MTRKRSGLIAACRCGDGPDRWRHWRATSVGIKEVYTALLTFIRRTAETFP
jgi:hypothetical protein